MANSDLYTTLDPEVYINGTAYWASLRTPNKISGKYEIDIVPDDPEVIREMGVELKTKDFGNGDEEYVKISSSSNAKYPIGVRFDEETTESGEPTTDNTLVGNGSTVRVLCELARTKFGKKEFIKLARPKVVRVKKLVEYSGKSGGLYDDD